ncbi:Rab5 GDP/GTP exchange factor [Geodia barretti]|uniref:Rab5 GDP/GTP exchange factor n=1 Tax=Geodia barretti TaxID=519541 RepID=A0AA35T100_GEOBA|nr:Rab5 GDP/GTP exchange factor [Geodia barretti]
MFTSHALVVCIPTTPISCALCRSRRSTGERRMEQGNRLKRLSNPDLRCRNKCGFYGNPIYMGFCSKCYKEQVRDAPGSQATPLVAAQDTTPTKSAASPGAFAAFTKFNVKKNVFATAKGKGKLFTKGKVTAGFDQPKEKKSKKSKVSDNTFSEFLKTLQKPAAKDLVQHLKFDHRMYSESVVCLADRFHKQITDRNDTATVEEQSEAVQEFYTSMSERLTTHTLFRDVAEEQQEDMMDGIEKHLMTNIFPIVYSPDSCDDAMRDLLLVRRIRMLHWLEPTHLDIPLNLHDLQVQEHVSASRQSLCDMDQKKAPQDKLLCISRCCQELLAALKISRDGPASADEFVPSLIFLIIYTSPQTLYSNINYISRFSHPMRIMSGEVGYYFTNLCGAVSFVENVRAKNLRIEEEEFNVKMGFVNGKTDIDLFLMEGEVEEEEDRERIMVLESCTERMKELSGQLKHMLGDINDLSRKVTESTRGLTEQVSTILSMPPPRVLLYQSPRVGQEGGATGLPPGRSTLQAPKRERGHERRWSGDKRSGDRKGFTSTL